MTKTKTCYACGGEFAAGYWRPEAGHIFVCVDCASDSDKLSGIYDDGSDKAEYVAVIIVQVSDADEAGPPWSEQIDSFGAVLSGSTDDEIVESAIQAVHERGYTVLRNEDGGNCEIAHYNGNTCRHVVVTVVS